MSDNKQWLNKQCSAFLDSKLTDDVLFEKAGLLREAAKKRGLCDKDVSAMYSGINAKRKEDVELEA